MLLCSVQLFLSQRHHEKCCSPVPASYSVIQMRGSVQVNNEKIQHILKSMLSFLMFGKESLSDLPYIP